ncbi:amidohydrolase family protein [Leisingera sp. F5]|uniref:amidohydrolase family protein n=1 Tax=Leisingera sp. F5 TaxID=1813816 RepID=UPI000A94EAE0|nr:amidohydrolase family protein [Leisingera sp. F5]
MRDLLLTGRWVVLSSADVRQDYAVLVRNGRVAKSGPAADMRDAHPGIPEWGGPGCAIMPGLINAHHHCYGPELLNQAVADDLLEPWMFSGPAMAGLSPYASTAYSAARLLRSGVTAVVDMCAAGPDQGAAETGLQKKAAAYRDAGIRAAIAPGERWQNRIVHGAGEEAAFLATLPGDLRKRLLESEARRQRLAPEEYFALISTLVPQGNGSQDFWFGPTGPQWTPDGLLLQIASAAERLNTRIQTHALESHYESIESPRIRGGSVIRHFENSGLLTGRLSLAHAVWATSEDIEHLARCGTQVSHNPSSNLRLRSGIAPAAAMVDAGVTTAIGMDGTSLAGDEDMFAEMRLALNLNRPPHGAAQSLTAQQVFAMATEHGARLMGREGELGQLHPGFCADAVVLDLERFLTPWSSTAVDPLELIAGRGKADDVRDVLVAGRPVLRNRICTGIDEPSLMKRVQQEADAAPPSPESRQLQRDLRPYLMRWYAQWDAWAADTHPPVMRYGARPSPTGKDLQ